MTLEEFREKNTSSGHNCHQCLVHVDPEDKIYTWYQEQESFYCSPECRTQVILDTEARNDPKSD